MTRVIFNMVERVKASLCGNPDFMVCINFFSLTSLCSRRMMLFSSPMFVQLLLFSFVSFLKIGEVSRVSICDLFH